MGIANIFYDRNVIMFLGGIPITGGMLSFVTLFLKGAFAVYGAYFLLLTVGIDRLCMALRKLKVPRMMVTVLLLTYRYLIVLLKEAQRMMQAYELRSFRHRGIHIRAWGLFRGCFCSEVWIGLYRYMTVCCCGDMTESFCMK